MGLDQYWNFKREDSEESEEFHYHRKVPALQQFMAKAWVEEGKVSGELREEGAFNCADVEVTNELLAKLEEALKDGGAGLNKNASGFFWGSHYDGDLEDIQEAVDKAYSHIRKGRRVFYSSWW